MDSTPCFTRRPNALWQGWSRQPAVTGASHSWNTVKADSISMMCRWKAGSRLWRLKNSDVGWWELEPADGLPTFWARAVNCMTFFCLQKGGLLAFRATLTLGCWEDTDRERVSRYHLRGSPCLLITAVDYWCWWRGRDRSQVTQTPHNHLLVLYKMWGNGQA